MLRSCSGQPVPLLQTVQGVCGQETASRGPRSTCHWLACACSLVLPHFTPRHTRCPLERPCTHTVTHMHTQAYASGPRAMADGPAAGLRRLRSRGQRPAVRLCLCDTRPVCPGTLFGEAPWTRGSILHLPGLAGDCLNKLPSLPRRTRSRRSQSGWRITPGRWSSWRAGTSRA